MDWSVTTHIKTTVRITNHHCSEPYKADIEKNKCICDDFPNTYTKFLYKPYTRLNMHQTHSNIKHIKH